MSLTKKNINKKILTDQGHKGHHTKYLNTERHHYEKLKGI